MHNQCIVKNPLNPTARSAGDAMKPAKDRPELQSVRQKTYADLKKLILSGKLRPAERVAESRLADLLGVSRTPLREALMKLEKEGLVVGQRNVGYRVADVDIDSICDLLVVRETIDAKAAELACERATDTDLEQIRQIVREMEALQQSNGAGPVDAARELELGLQIHKDIARSTRNSALIRIADQLYEQLQLALSLEVLWIDLGDMGLQEHQAIANALCARDAKAASAAASKHVQSSLRSMTRIREILKHRKL